MGVLSNHKIKIIASLAGTTVIASGVTIPYLTHKNISSPEPENGDNVPIYPNVKKPITPATKMSSQNQEPQESTSSKLAKLKNEKLTLLGNVENQMTSYKNMIKSIIDVKKLEEELNKCFSNGEIKDKVTDEEKQKLKDNYEAVKADSKRYEKIQKKIKEGELKQKESYADSDNTNEERYEDFKSKFDEINGEYKDVINKKSGENLYSSFSKIKSKLNLNNQQCSLKDIIKMNDAIGTKHGVRN